MENSFQRKINGNKFIHLQSKSFRKAEMFATSMLIPKIPSVPGSLAEVNCVQKLSNSAINIKATDCQLLAFNPVFPKWGDSLKKFQIISRKISPDIRPAAR